MSNAKERWAEATRRDGIAHQRDAQLTWWSILQGIAMGEFVVLLPVIFTNAWQSKEYYVFAFVVATFLFLVNIWIQMAWAIIVLQWPLRSTHVILTTILGIVSVFLVRTMTVPLQWLATAMVLGCTAIGVYVYNWKREAYTWDDEEARWRPIVEIIVYLIVTIVLALWIYFRPSTISYSVSGLVAIFISIIALRSQSRRMKTEKEKVGIP